LEGKIRLLDTNGDEFETVSGSSAGGLVSAGAVAGENKFSVSDEY
jgi:predicted acylesterase/phospholipase RssA